MSEIHSEFRFAQYEGHPIKNEMFVCSAVNLHARLNEILFKASMSFCYSIEPYSTSYTVSTFFLLGKHPWTAQYRWSPLQKINVYILFSMNTYICSCNLSITNRGKT